MKVTLNDIQAAQQTIQNFINLTPSDYSRSCSTLMGADIFFKLEKITSAPEVLKSEVLPIKLPPSQKVNDPKVSLPVLPVIMRKAWP